MRLERESEILNRMMASEKLILLGKMASGIAHEINNPIMIIQNYISLWLMEIQEKGSIEMKQGGENFQILNDIISECRRMGKITKNMLEFSRSQAEFNVFVDIHQTLEEVIRLLRPFMEKNQIHFKLEINSPKFSVWGRKDELQQVFVNFIDNSMYALREKYSAGAVNENEKFIRISTTLIEKVDESGKKEYIAIEFYDDGCGIQQEYIPMIFEPFFTTKKSKVNLDEEHKHEGLGLGLPYCRNIAMKYEGWIEFKTEAGYFTQFKILLPVSENVKEIDTVIF